MNFFFALGAFHGLLFLVTAIIIIYSDHQGYLYFRGKKQTLSPRFVKWSHRLVWTGLLLIITTGLALMLPAWDYYLTQPPFYIKMSFVGVLILNGIAIGQLSKKAERTPFSALTNSEQKTLLVSGGLSFMSWVGAASIGIFVL